MQTVVAPTAPPGVMVGIAFSGGGSRAATFSAAVLRELASVDIGPAGSPSSVLEKAQYLSSVSGGSLAATYFAANKPPAAVRMLEGKMLSEKYREFFDRDFLPSMTANWEGPLVGTALGDAIPRGDAIAARWDESLFKGATFLDLTKKELAGDAPWLIVNGTSWDSGRRFVFTALPASAFDYDFVKTARRVMRDRGADPDDVAMIEQRLQPESNRFVPMTFEETNVDPSTLKLSLAVASSSSVPLLIGPVTYSVQRPQGPNQLLHIGDGGMFDNQGIESLAQVMFPTLMTTPDAAPVRKHGLMIVIDASYPFDGGGDIYSHSSGLLAMIDKSPGRISDIMEQRASAYQLLLWGSLRSTQDAAHEIVPDPEHLTIVYLRHTDAYVTLAKSPPPQCTQWLKVKPSEAEMLSYLSKIPTRFRLVDKCDAALLEASAVIAVESSRPRILRAMAQ